MMARDKLTALLSGVISLPAIAWLTKMAVIKPKKAAISIIPSMAMFTTPARSQYIPAIPPITNGVDTCSVVRIMLTMIKDAAICV